MNIFHNITEFKKLLILAPKQIKFGGSVVVGSVVVGSVVTGSVVTHPQSTNYGATELAYINLLHFYFIILPQDLFTLCCKTKLSIIADISFQCPDGDDVVYWRLLQDPLLHSKRFSPTIPHLWLNSNRS